MATLPVAVVAQSQPVVASGVPSVAIPKTTEMVVMLTPKQAWPLNKSWPVIPQRFGRLVKLYLGGKIRQWYSRGDGRGVIFLVDAKTEDEARTVMETLPPRRPGWSLGGAL